MRADSLGFLSPQGTLPEADPLLSQNLDLLHVTAAVPMLKESIALLRGTERFPSIAEFRRTLESQDNLCIIETSEDLASIGNHTKTGIILGLQEAPHDADKEVLKDLHDEGIRVITLSYQDADHPFGSGYTNPNGRLTDRGRQFLLDCEDVGIIVDLSHVGHQTARDVLEFRDKGKLAFPVFASHGGIYEEFDGDKKHINNTRNLPWDVLEGIADADGTVGIYALTFGLSESDNSVKPFINQIVSASERLGNNVVTIGTDSIYKKRDEIEWKKIVEWLTSQLVKPGELMPRYPDYPLELNRQDKLSVVKNHLISAGLTSKIIDGVIGDTAANFFKTNIR